MSRDRICPSCRATWRDDRPRAADRCTACAGAPAALAIQLSPVRALTTAPSLPLVLSGDPGWLLAPLLGTLGVALGLLAVSHVAALVVWAAGSAATVGAAAWVAHRSSARPGRQRGALPSAVTLPRRYRPRRKPPAGNRAL